MKYTLGILQNCFTQKERLEYTFFWGHQTSKDGSISKACFSQWWACDFCIDGIQYHSAEQYMMAEKANLFADFEIREKILQSNQPKQTKELGRMIKGFQEDIWVAHRFDIVKHGNLAKFSQNNALGAFLLQTQDRFLVEASPEDKIWGIGMAENDVDAQNPLKWKGLNLLGFALMEVRDELKRCLHSSTVGQ